MTNPETPDLEYHVVLIGIDAYGDFRPLRGCVSDIDAVQRLLLERAGIPASQITRLVSPHPTPERHSIVPAQPATAANIRAALSKLASERVGSRDRILVYYAGHGARPEVRRTDSSAFRGELSQRHEALVPVDAAKNGTNLLFDVEFNALLAGIAERTSSIAVVLDCCHSSGATRSLDGPDGNTRFVDIGPVEITPEHELSRFAAPTRSTGAPGTGVDVCQVLAACQSHEYAYEVPRKIPPGRTRSGLLTRSLIAALGQIPDEEIATIPWGRVWNQVRASVETEPEAQGRQHPWMSGGLARAWLGGPPTDGDVGLGVERSGDPPDEYVIRAGTVAGITRGARVAVYDAQPDSFSRLGTADDLEERVGVLLEVIEATPSRATAVALGTPFDLPAGVRGRLVQPGESERLACAVIPETPEIVAALAASELIEVTGGAHAVARLEQQDDGSWVLTDDIHAARPGEPTLVRLPSAEVVDLARDVMEHYVRYAGPMNMAKRCPDLPGALRLSLLHCPDARVPQPTIPDLRPLPTEVDGSYALQDGTLFCVRVSNASTEHLRVRLFNADARGTVAQLGDQIVGPGLAEYFWWKDEIGLAFPASVPNGMDRCIDRMTVIGTTDMASDLRYLEEKRTFAVDRSIRAIGDDVAPPRSPPPPVDRWTATEAIVRTSAGES